MHTIQAFYQIAKKDLVEFSRDRIRLVTFIVMPVFMMIMTGFIFPSQSTIKNVPIGIVNQDSEMGKKLEKAISGLEVTKGSRAFRIKNYDDLSSIKEAIRKQDINGAVIIPSGFSEKLSANRQTEVTIFQDQSNLQISALTTQVLSQVVEGFAKGISAQKVGQILVSRELIIDQSTDSSFKDQVSAIITPIAIRLDGLFSGDVSYFEFVAPGVMAMVVITAVLTGLAASVSREKEQGTLDGILISPVSRLSIILGKALSQSIRGLTQGVIVLFLAVFLFGVKVNGSILLVALLLLLSIFSFVGLGILVSAAAAEQETATQLLFMFQFPMLFLSGVFFPIQQMPAVMQKIAHVLPLTYAIESLRKVMILGGGLSSVTNEIIILALFGATTLAVAVPLFRKVITR